MTGKERADWYDGESEDWGLWGREAKPEALEVILKEDYVNRVVKVKRVQDRIMRLKLEIKGVIVECVYAPKVG